LGPSLLSPLRLLFPLAPSLPPSSPLFPYATLFRSHDPVGRFRRRPAGPAGRRRGRPARHAGALNPARVAAPRTLPGRHVVHAPRSEEHTSELQSRENLVCRLLLEKKKLIHNNNRHP